MLLAFAITGAQGAIINQGESAFNKQWEDGTWDYMDLVAAERLRNAAIGAVLVQKYCRPVENCTILEVGCGEGAVVDFLTPSQREKYTGFDVSEHAITIAKTKRPTGSSGGGPHFIHANAHDINFTPDQTFDAIIFSEVLYYLEHENAIDKFVQYLAPSGVVIISLHVPHHDKKAFDGIFMYAEKKLQLFDVVDVGGRGHPPHPESTHFKIKVLIPLNQTIQTDLEKAHEKRLRGPPMPGEGGLVRGDDKQVFLIRSGSLHAIPNLATFLAMGFEFSQVVHIPGWRLSKEMPLGEPIPSRDA